MRPVESRMRWKPHVRFGERAGETDRQRCRHRAPVRLHEERRGAWRWERRRVSRAEQYKQLTGWDHPVLAFGISPARGTLLRLDPAFAGFFPRVKASQTPGFPRFKSISRWDSGEYPTR